MYSFDWDTLTLEIWRNLFPSFRLQQLEKELYFYKKTSRDLKKKIREMFSNGKIPAHSKWVNMCERPDHSAATRLFLPRHVFSLRPIYRQGESFSSEHYFAQWPSILFIFWIFFSRPITQYLFSFWHSHNKMTYTGKSWSVFLLKSVFIDLLNFSTVTNLFCW